MSDILNQIKEYCCRVIVIVTLVILLIVIVQVQVNYAQPIMTVRSTKIKG